MACLSTYLENALLEHVFNGVTYTIPTIYLGLYSAAPTDAGGGTEFSAVGYARKATTAADWATATAGKITNGQTITMVQAGITWGLAVAFGLFDASSAGNLLAWGDISPQKTIGQGDTAQFPINGLTIDPD